MLEFPESTVIIKKIPKQKFYDNISITPALKKVFTENIKQIIWNNKIAASTLNLAVGKNVTEIEVFKVELNSKELNQNVLLQIDREIPYHILFILCFENEVQAWIGYKEEAQNGNNAFKVSSYYHTEWINKDALDLRIEGLDIDKVYENFIKQINGCSWNNAISLSENINIIERKEKLQKEIDKLEKLARKEIQPKKKFELVNQKRKLEEELKKL